MNEPSKRYWSQADVITRLAQLGVAESQLREAAAFGVGEASRCTENDPAVARGFIQWEKTFRGLCDALLLAGGWRRSDDLIYPRLTNSDGTIAIAVMGGNTATGTAEEPASRQPKGVLSRLVIQANLFDLSTIALGPQKPGQTWHLMYYTDWATGETRLELSHAISMEPDGRIAGWSERIILRPLDGEPASVQPEESDDEGPEIAVERRTG